MGVSSGFIFNLWECEHVERGSLGGFWFMHFLLRVCIVSFLLFLHSILFSSELYDDDDDGDDDIDDYYDGV